MTEAEFACPKCKTVFSVEPGTTDLASTCPTCASELEAHFFPAFFQPVEAGMAASALVDQADASCFYHPQKQAVHVCDGCGRLVCALCSIDLGAEHLCPSCVSSGKKKGKLLALENSRVRYDTIALALAVVGLFSCYLSLLLAPASIYVALRYWKSPRGLTGASPIRLILALVIALTALLAWSALFGLTIFSAARTRAAAAHYHHHR